MSPIRILDPTLINQIAAGEVIVRPASVVKELVENSLDAGAARIAVEVDAECRSMRVVDDGCGMLASDAELSIQRHATSKIASFDDLSRVATRGFRGEALASIVAVSRFEILTRPAEAVAGTRLRAEGGALLEVARAGCPPGTTVEVRDLFYNTPARLKFMKSPASEWGQIQTVLTRQALAAPLTGFVVSRAGKKAWEAPPGQTLLARIAQLFGPRFAEDLLEVAQSSDDMAYGGFIGRPSCDRADRRQQFFFVNGRPIVSTRLSAILQEAFKGLMLSGRYPVAVVRIDAPPGEVDVNVHPTKEEVRFRDERKVGGLLHRALVGTLRAANLAPTYFAPPSREPGEAPSAAPSPDPTLPLLFGTRKIRTDSSWPPATSTPSMSSIPSTPPIPSIPPPLPHVAADAPLPDRFSDDAQSVEEQVYALLGGVEPNPIGQLGDSYILAQLGADLLIIDQHAAHERLLYARAQAALRRPDVQPLLVPFSFRPAPADVANLEQIIPQLAALGIEVEPFGGGDYIVRAVPADFADLDMGAVIQDLLDAYHGRGVADPDAVVRDKAITRMACRAAIKAGQRLAPEEIARLIDDLLSARLTFTCPHGRPTMILLTKDQLDRQFKRK
ncbi:MAG: DNA mismatch repair endonuclease MutL [Candidatus Sumerlaeota bacterium]|nr:DNA mismatch repair endonuclease MutL [Candidatus Sumerlaeota bacterium]